MLRYDQEFPVRATTIFTNNLVHENIMVRKASLHVVDCILKQNKRKHPKISVKLKVSTSDNCDRAEYMPVQAHIENGDTNLDTCDVKSDSNLMKDIFIPSNSCNVAIEEPFLVKPGERPDNAFLQYKSKNIPLSEEEYNQPRFVNKTYFGYYVWPPESIIYAPSEQQPELDRSVEDLSDSEKVIYHFFNDADKIETLVEFLSLENKKGQDQFDAERFGMFKGLFRNFGDVFIPTFKTYIERLVGEHQESHQRAAAELLAAIIRGSKHWPYSKVRVYSCPFLG